MKKLRIGNRLKELKKANGENNDSLGAICGVSGVSYWRWESGQHAIPLDAAILLARHYGINISEIVNGENSEPRARNLDLKVVASMISDNHEIITLMAQLPKDSPAFEMIKDLLEGAIESESSELESHQSKASHD